MSKMFSEESLKRSKVAVTFVTLSIKLQSFGVVENFFDNFDSLIFYFDLPNNCFIFVKQIYSRGLYNKTYYGFNKILTNFDLYGSF